MGAGHGAALYVNGSSRLHRMRPECKLVGAFGFVIAVVATPREQFWAYAVYVALVVAVARLSHLSLTTVARRLVIEAPFVAFAVFLPFIAEGERIDVGPLSLSADGLWGAWNILIKGTIGVAVSVVVASTTELPELLRGLERLRVPRAFTFIASFMVRYGDVVAGEMRRMKVARQSRGHDARWIWQARAVGHSAGALFIRSYERGERVYLAMLSRGYTGALPVLDAGGHAGPRQWALSLSMPMTAVVVASAAWTVQV